MKLLRKREIKMKLFRYVVLTVMLLEGCRFANSDLIYFTRDMDRPLGNLQVDCNVEQTWGWSRNLDDKSTEIWFRREYSTRIVMPSHHDKGQKPGLCLAGMDMCGDDIGFAVYSYHRDHGRCRRRCFFEARSDGLYAKNETIGTWDLIEAYSCPRF